MSERRPDAVEANRRLTASVAALLLVLLAIQGATVVLIRPLLPLHVFIGMLLIPPILLKLGSTGYRFVRYYLGDPAFRRRGPPLLALRLLAPGLIGLTVLLFASGVGLLFTAPGGGLLLTLHQGLFVLWFLVMTIHVLAYVWELPASTSADWLRGRSIPRGRATRVQLLGASLIAGAVLGAAFLPLATPWMHWIAVAGGGG